MPIHCKKDYAHVVHMQLMLGPHSFRTGLRFTCESFFQRLLFPSYFGAIRFYLAKMLVQFVGTIVNA